MKAARDGSRDIWRQAGKEPAIEDMLADPLVHLVMQRDCVSIDQLRAVIVRAQVALRNRLCCRAAA